MNRETSPKHNDKYITFSREDWVQWWNQPGIGGTIHDIVTPKEIEDAVIIRRQDIFAPPAFDAYANAMTVVMVTLASGEWNVEDQRSIDRLKEISDYFHEQAVLSWSTERKMPD